MNNSHSKQSLAQLKEDVLTLATSQGRKIGTKGHKNAQKYLLKRIKSLGLAPYSQDSYEFPYQVDGEKFCNLLGTLPGKNPELNPILIAAHYDTCGALPGADDNAAAVSIALESVKMLRQKQLDRSLIFAFFDAEEPPYFLSPSMGSVYFYENQRKEEIHCALVMDLVGHDTPLPGLEEMMFITGMETDPQLEKVLRSCENSVKNLKTTPTLNSYIGSMSDYYIFQKNQRPYLFFSCGRWEHYHTATDTPEKLSYRKMLAIRDYLVKVTEQVCKTSLKGPFEDYDTSATEIYFMKKHFGHLLSQMGFEPKRREDIDRIVSYLLGHFDL